MNPVLYNLYSLKKLTTFTAEVNYGGFIRKESCLGVVISYARLRVLAEGISKRWLKFYRGR
jgi:hypothetical protein